MKFRHQAATTIQKIRKILKGHPVESGSWRVNVATNIMNIAAPKMYGMDWITRGLRSANTYDAVLEGR